MKSFDLIVAAILLFTALIGFKNGLIQTLFKTIGYIAGGVLGLAISLEVIKNWQSPFAKLGLALLLIFTIATISEYLLGKIGKGVHKRILFGPFKLIDSLLGACLSILRTVVLIYLSAILLIASPWGWADSNIDNSKFYTYIEDHLPKLITDYQPKVEEIFKKIN
jgi:uncharacterized membrane protein required for colicin V production